MAKYLVMGEPHHRANPYEEYPVGSTITLPDDELPNSRWEPLDEPAQKAMAEQRRLNKVKASWGRKGSENEGAEFDKDGKFRSEMPLPKPPYDAAVLRHNEQVEENEQVRLKKALEAGNLDEVPGRIGEIGGGQLGGASLPPQVQQAIKNVATKKRAADRDA